MFIRNCPTGVCKASNTTLVPYLRGYTNFHRFVCHNLALSDLDCLFLLQDINVHDISDMLTGLTEKWHIL